MDFLYFIISCLYFFLPAYFTNMTPPLVKRISLFNFLDKEVDFGKNFLGQPIFGKHKSWRGVILGIIVGILVAFIQKYLYQFPAIKKISLLLDIDEGDSPQCIHHIINRHPYFSTPQGL